jgi:MoaA/NifB/PqqE/SkfB family radical SAM enzyme
MRAAEKVKGSKLSVDYVKRILDAAREKDVKIVSFTGRDPLLYLDELVAMINYAGSAGFQDIRTGTNGLIFSNPQHPHFHAHITRIVKTLAATPLRNFWIRVDSIASSIHETMRGASGMIAGIEKALPIFHNHGIYPSANMGINRNITEHTATLLKRYSGTSKNEYLQAFYYEFKQAFDSFYRFAISLGFTMAGVCYPMNIKSNESPDLKPVYEATSEEDIVRFSDQEKTWLYKTLLETVPKFRSQLRVTTPLSSLYALHKKYLKSSITPYPCRGGIDFFFIDAKEGNTYPCAYRGNENLGKYWELDIDSLDTRTTCSQCDWEYFRDPSELFGPILNVLTNPFEFVTKFRRENEYFRLWMEDVKYYRACDFFDGRKPPDLIRLDMARQAEKTDQLQSPIRDPYRYSQW